MKILTFVVSILIMIAVLIPGSKIPDVNLIGIDKVVHLCMFSAWAVALRFDFPGVKPWIVFMLGMLFSLVTEVVQLFAEGRSFDLFDMVFDGIGLTIGLLIAKPVIKFMDRFFSPKP